MGRLGFCALVAFAALVASLRPSPLTAAQTWHIRAGASFAGADGSFRAQRANGKIVTSDIDSGFPLLGRLERRLTPRLGITLGGLGGSTHHFIIHQDFPDGTEFEARDEFVFRAVTAGVALHYRQGRSVGLFVEPFVLWAWYDDVSIASAGLPFDRTLPIDVDVDANPGVGVISGIELELADGLSLEPWIGFAAVRFSGPFPEDPVIPGTDGEIGVDFSPAMVGLALGIRF